MSAACSIHNIAFYKPKVKPIYCMALHPNHIHLAVSRSDASIEIWNIAHAPHIERTIAGTADNFSIEGLTWCGTRLFSCGLHGLLIEYDLRALCVKDRAVVTGEAAFCLDVNADRSQIAVGTEHGYLNVFNVGHGDDNPVVFDRFFDKQEGRILCVRYNCEGTYIVSGGIDAIRVWDVGTGQAVHKMTTGRAEAGKATIIWCLTITADFTIISGDSRGILSFWDGNAGSQIECFQSHRADILSVCLSDDNNIVYCAGVDPAINSYTRIRNHQKSATVASSPWSWVKNIDRKIHSHDVRALILSDKRLYSGGVDAYLVCSLSLNSHYKYPPIMQNPCVYVSDANPAAVPSLVALRYSDYVEVWRLGAMGIDGRLGVAKRPKKLLHLIKTVKNADGDAVNESIICSAMSADGKWIMISTQQYGVRLFHFKYDEEKPELIRVEIINDTTILCVNAIFSTNNNLLIIATPNGDLKIIDLLQSESPTIIQTIEKNKNLTDTITFLTVSRCGKYLVAGDPKSNIVIWRLMKNKKYSFDSKLPRYKVAAPTAIAIHPETLNLVVAYADIKVVEYEIENKKFSDFSRLFSHNNINLSKQNDDDDDDKVSLRFPIRTITFDPKAKHIIMLHDVNSIFVLNKQKSISNNHIDTKVPKLDMDSDKNRSIDSSTTHNFDKIKDSKYLVQVNWLEKDEIVAVTIPPLNLLEQLPPCILQNTFGTK